MPTKSKEGVKDHSPRPPDSSRSPAPVKQEQDRAHGHRPPGDATVHGAASPAVAVPATPCVASCARRPWRLERRARLPAPVIRGRTTARRWCWCTECAYARAQVEVGVRGGVGAENDGGARLIKRPRHVHSWPGVQRPELVLAVLGCYRDPEKIAEATNVRAVACAPDPRRVEN